MENNFEKWQWCANEIVLLLQLRRLFFVLERKPQVGMADVCRLYNYLSFNIHLSLVVIHSNF